MGAVAFCCVARPGGAQRRVLSLGLGLIPGPGLASQAPTYAMRAW